MAWAEQVAEAGPPELSLLGASILLALNLGLAEDSRGAARLLGLEHAFILREAAVLSHDLGLVIIPRRDDRTQRLWLALAPQAVAFLAPLTQDFLAQ